MSSLFDVEVDISFLSTEEGGRGGYVTHRYFPQYEIDEGLRTGGAHQFLDADSVQPGESARAGVKFLGADALSAKLRVGRSVRVLEGPKLVAHATITKIWNQALEEHS